MTSRLIGAAMLIFIFIVMYFFMIRDLGARTASLIFGGIVILGIWVLIAICFLQEFNPLDLPEIILK